MAKEFEVRFDGLLPAEPDRAWAAITTSQTAGWLWEIDYEPRLGGAERGLSGDGGKVTAWEPNRHFATRAQRSDGWFKPTVEVVGLARYPMPDSPRVMAPPDSPRTMAPDSPRVTAPAGDAPLQ